MLRGPIERYPMNPNEPMQSTDPDLAYLSMAGAAKVTPGRPGSAAVWRWCVKGIRVPDGSRLRLEHTRMGGQLYTTRHWLTEFARKLAEAKNKTL